MKKAAILLLAMALPALGPSDGRAGVVDFNLAEFYLDADAGFSSDLSAFDTATGLGSISTTMNVAGLHYLNAFFDHEIDQQSNTFFNEYGGTSGTPAGGQTWEIDEPGYVFGDIYDNFWVNTLDNSNGVPSGAEDDVSMALGWNFILAPGEIATITFRVSNTAPADGFYLFQTDPDSEATIYLSSSASIRDGGTAVPEPGTLALLAAGLVGLAGFSRKRRTRA